MEAAELAESVDAFHLVREERLESDRNSKLLKSRETALKALIINELRQQGVPVVGGKILTVQLKKVIKPTAADWPAIYDYIRATDSFDLLHRRLTETAVILRWEDDINIPGIVEATIYDLSLSTVRR